MQNLTLDLLLSYVLLKGSEDGVTEDFESFCYHIAMEKKDTNYDWEDADEKNKSHQGKGTMGIK